MNIFKYIILFKIIFTSSIPFLISLPYNILKHILLYRNNSPIS